MSGAHTPGPWRRAGEVLGRYKIITVSGKRMIGEASGYNENAEENVCLMAAAPYMLDALKKIARYDDDMSAREKADIARAAIAEVTGAAS